MGLLKIGAAWLKDGRRGKFMSVRITTESGDQNYLMFRNKFKREGDNKPDYEVFASTDEDEATDKRREAPQGVRDDFQVSDDDVPF